MKAVPQPICQAAFFIVQPEDEAVGKSEPAAVSALAMSHRDAVQQMVQQHSRLVYRVAFAVVRNAADAEDVVQETFLQLLRGSPTITAVGAIADQPAYLARVAWRLALRRRQQPGPHERSGEILQSQPFPGKNPEQAALDGAMESWLHRCINELPPKLRQPLVLAALSDLTSPQIASVLGIPQGSVRRRIHAARQILKRKMKDHLQQRKGESQ